MPNFCAVVGCGSRGNRDSNSFFRIPSIPTRGTAEFVKLKTERREQWISALKRRDLTDSKLKYAQICDKHFITGRPAELNDRSHPDWIPTVLMGYKTKLDVPCNVERYKRAKLRSNTPAHGNIHNELSSADVISSICSDEIETEVVAASEVSSLHLCNAEIQTDMSMIDIENITNMINHQNCEISGLKEKLQSFVVCEDSFTDDKKTKFYTGLANFQLLMILYRLICNDLTETSRSSLTKFQQMILTLQRLRLNLSLTDLAYRFGICTATASKIFQTCTYVMWKRLKRLIVWPERENLWATMPSTFLDSFGKKIVVIVDCFEIKTEKPSNLLSSAQVWSNYKQHHTTKFLIGICPQGSISFISNGWGGKSSDKEIALNCGILENLLPGDLVLADRGFLISDAVGLYCAEVKMPSFTRGRKQLLPFEVEESRKISHIRIHVERVIGSLRQKYQILHSVLPIHVLQNQGFEDAPSLINQIVTICCALLNMCPSV